MRRLFLISCYIYLFGVVFGATLVNVSISVKTGGVESDWSNVYYGLKNPLLLGNDGNAATGGFRVWSIDSRDSLQEIASKTPGRTKLVSTVYGVGGQDYIVTIAQPDSLIRIYRLDDMGEVENARVKILGDWSAFCPWKSQESGNQYLYLFGKHFTVQLLMRETTAGPELVEIQKFDMPVEASSCAVSSSLGILYFSGDDSKTIFQFKALDSANNPEIIELGDAEDNVTGLSIYVDHESDLLLVAQTNVIGIFTHTLSLIGSIEVTGEEDLEIQGLNIYQGNTSSYPAGVFTFAYESKDGTGFALAPVESAFMELGIDTNTAYNPREAPCSGNCSITICPNCKFHGFCMSGAACDCFSGFTGSDCSEIICEDNCSGNGQCIGANQCRCDDGWGGLHCSFVMVEPTAETDANGGDGDDPAIWISPIDPSHSRIITTTKSEQGPGFGVFDLSGKLLEMTAAGEPNNVDVIYGFQAKNRTIDMVYAACRADDTLCLFEIDSTGMLQPIAGGIQPTKEGFSVYGSCAYKSKGSGKQYLFVNSKTSEYLQYELTWSGESLNTLLVRSFMAGSGGQVEGCVADVENGWVFIGEEPYGLWRYGAEPDDNSEGVLVAQVGDGNLHADVEGVTMVEGKTQDQGLIFVSAQGVSGFVVYRRASPHDYVTTFSIVESRDGSIDAVSNTDGLAVVGTNLSERFPRGLVVVHDDANQLPDGSTSAEASFKLVDLLRILGAQQLRGMDLLSEVDSERNTRA